MSAAVADARSRPSFIFTETLMPTSAFRLLALVGAIAVTTLLGACGDGLSSPAPTPAASAKSACGNATLANARMSCPPGFVPPAS